jgi:ElaB/YqjD/DUF883 family membrane-anchored ribosome-binding protein
MTTTNTVEPSTAAEVVHTAKHVAHEARLLKELATDAVGDGVYAARRAAKVATRNLVDARDDVVYRIKKQPLQAVAIALAVGAGLGMLCGLVSRGRRKAVWSEASRHA